MRLTIATLATMLCVSGCASLPSGPLSTNAQRTILSSDTATTPHGSLELELGSTSSSGSALELPLNLKLGVSAATEVFIGGSVQHRAERPGGGRASGTGDLGLGLRHLFLAESERAPSLAFELGATLPTADAARGLGGGETDVFMSLLAAKDLGLPTLFGRAQIGALGQADGSFDVEHTLALALGIPCSANTSFFSELAGSIAPESGTEQATATIGVAWAVSESVLSEVGWRTGLTGDSGPDQLLFGITWNFGPIL